MTNKILVIKHGSFGDIIQINGCLRDIRENYIDNEIYITVSYTHLRANENPEHMGLRIKV